MAKKKITIAFSQHDVDELQEAITFQKEGKVFQWEYDGVVIDIYAEN
jgi:predicted nucleic acid-binding protein